MINIYAFASNRPDLLKLQGQSFQKHLTEVYQYTVFNNAQHDCASGANLQAINNACREVNATEIVVRRDADLEMRCQADEPSGPIFSKGGRYTSANVAHAYALRYAWETVISKQAGVIAVMDSDVFLIQDIRLTDALRPHAMLNIEDGRPTPKGDVHYMWPTLMIADMSRLPNPKTLNWWCGRINDVPVDVGGQTYWYFLANPELDIAHIQKKHFTGDAGCVFPGNYDEFYLNGGTVLHYRSGSDWDRRGSDYHEKKTVWLKGRIG